MSQNLELILIMIWCSSRDDRKKADLNQKKTFFLLFHAETI